LPACAQRRDFDLIDLKVYVQTADTRAAVGHVRVDLLDGTGGVMIRQNYTDESGMVEFLQLQPDTYRLKVSDPDIEELTTDIFRIERRQMQAYQTLAIRLKPNAKPRYLSGTVSAGELKAPKKARSEFEKGSKALDKNQLEEARAHFEKAIAIYPQYARAYNHLGVSLMRAGQPEPGKQAFEKAVAIDDKYPEALLNLAKVRLAEQNHAEAEKLLRQAGASDPGNPEVLTILANVLLLEGKYEEAAATAVKVHPLGDEKFTAAHYIAGRAYELQHKDAEAIAEYTILLKETPSGPVADKARASLKTLREQNYAH
jgi:tetratricopeptide (TPR) repeat protein